MKTNTLDDLPKDTPLWLSNFVSVYQRLETNNLRLLDTIYHREVTFIDPLNHLEGFDELYRYFEGLYQNLQSCEFIIENTIFHGNEAAIYWTMTYQHNKLNQGKSVTVAGSSYIKGEGDKVILHRDYLDLGAMIYEQLPLFGKLTKWVKARVVS
mgnify:FL=1